VYLGHDSQLDRPVAIKVFRGGAEVPPAEADRLLQEARRLARLRHSGIVAVHDVGTQDGQVFIVSDYLDGQDLAHWLKRNSPSWQEAVAIVAALADALAHAHAQFTIHRDVKPANIILTSSGAPVLVDFGLALDDSTAGAGELGIVSGTPAYMAPEQVAGTAHRIDGRTDIYSLGVVLYEMLCGRIPFRSEKSHELLRQVRDDEPQPLRQIAREIPPELERICLKTLAKKMQDRYTTAADFADELRRLLQTTSESALPPSSLRQSAARQSIAGMSGGPSYRETSQHQSETLSSSRRRVREAARRQVTVLVCGSEVFESEAYLEISDAEDQAKVLQVFEQICERAVRGLDGTVVQCNEQGFLACFGYPVAYEDAARRAARAGLRMLDELKDLGDQLRRKHHLELNPWVGIHTGPAVVETKGEAVSLVGEARNAALRLGDVAVPGQIICTEDTHRLFLGRFQCASLGHKKIKGMAQAVQLFQVEGIAWAGSLIEASAPAELSPLTGRDQESSLLKDRWEQAQEGMGQIVLLVGEPGLGKSRLVYTLKEHVLGQIIEGETDSPVIEWRCSPHFQNTGLYPAVDFLERALEFSQDDPLQARFDRLVHYLEQYELARPETVPLWASLLSLPTTDRFPPLSLSPPRQREETFRAMVEWLRTRAAQRPILFIVEDLHWMDASTLEFLEQFIAEGLHDRILTVLTFRPEFKTPWPSVAHQTSLALNRLTRRQAGELMRKKSGGALSEALIEQIYDRTGGVPLFVEEFTKMVQESAAPAGAGEGGAPAAVIPAHQIPATLQDLMNARLDRMEGEQEVAQLAATLGREFSHELLAAVATQDEADLQSELDKLVHAEILYCKGRPPGCTYTFKHALLEDALYNSLVKSKRQEFHQRAAAALEARFPQTVEHRPELLAHHFTEAGLAERAVGYWLRAGLRSKERSADVEAIGHLTKGLALLNTLGESPERDGRELQFLTTLGPAYIAVRGYAAPEVGPILQRARELCERIGDPKQLFGIMLGMWEWRLVRGDLRQAEQLAADGMALAESLNDPGMLMEALFMPGATMFYRGQFAGARANCEKALAAYDDRERTKFWTAYTGHNGGVTHRNYLSLALWHLGYPDQALKMDREARELARTIGHAYSLGHAVDFTAFLSHYCRLGTEVLAAADEELILGAEQGFQLWHALGTLHKGAGQLLKGQRDEALPLLLKGFSDFRATGAGVRAPCYLSMLGDAYTQCARFEEAHKALDEGLAVAEKNDDRCHEAELYRLKGELVLAESPDQVGAAEDYFRKAIDMARRQQSRAWVLRATMSLARLWQRQGRRAEARDALSAVYGAYSEGFTMPDLVDAAALLETLT
jgi:serine/threonine protein kinase/tetratricopeptide (TPR) repeat protein